MIWLGLEGICLFMNTVGVTVKIFPILEDESRQLVKYLPTPFQSLTLGSALGLELRLGLGQG